MMTATVLPSMEAVLYIKLRGNGMEVIIPATIDTGFSEFASLPQSWIDALSYPLLYTDNVTLANGDRILVNIHEGVVVWDGQERVIPIHCLEGDALVGMSLMYDYLLHLPVRVQSVVQLTPLP